MLTKTKVINFFAGPGAGKSTTATGVFSKLKQKGILCEYVSEYAKDLTWDETPKLLSNQIHVFAEQFRRQWRLIDKVDFIITDSPLFLSSVYYRFYTLKQGGSKFSDYYNEILCTMFDQAFLEFNNINFYINRNKPYVPVGRNQSQDEAIIIDNEVYSRLQEQKIKFQVTDSQRSIYDTIIHLEKEKLI